MQAAMVEQTNAATHLPINNNPLSPPSDPVQRRLQSPPAKNKFLAVKSKFLAVAVALVRAVRSQAIARGFQFEENRTAQVTK